MHTSVLSVLKYACGYTEGDTLLIGVSGGPDSLALLHILSQCGILLVVGHLDHGLRETSRNDFQYVKKIAEQYNLSFVGDRVNTKKYAAENKLSVEEAARELRYQFLFNQAKNHGCSAVVVGHTADDQVETVLMHFLRGAGLDGLSGMGYRTLTNWDPKLPLFRPMLGFWRKDVLEYCKDNGLEPLYDRSNLDQTFFRNRIRHELIPFLMQYNPKLKEVVWKTANTLAADRKILEQKTREIYKSVLVQEGKGYCSLKIKSFLNLEVAFQRRILRYCFSSLLPDLRDIGFDKIEKCIQALKNPPRSKLTDLFGGMKIWIGNGAFVIFENSVELFSGFGPQISKNTDYLLSIPGELELESGWIVKSEVFDFKSSHMEKIFKNENGNVAYLDAGKCPDVLLLRLREAGERFSPLGMGGKSLKLSDYMINLKIPVFLRDNWPIVTTNNKIIWVPGYTISHGVRVTKSTKSIVKLVLNKTKLENRE